ncbi:hypothetical protein [Rhodanobacter aciditrophus]|uniref:hypothetical protein n=1 Tax=Rhodanobacter aciditrophus TaxID=1623218 RepID=UPI003CFAE497
MARTIDALKKMGDSRMVLTPEQLHSLKRLDVWPRLDAVPEEHIRLFRELGLVVDILGGQGCKPNDRGHRVILSGGKVD